MHRTTTNENMRTCLFISSNIPQHPYPNHDLRPGLYHVSRHIEMQYLPDSKPRISQLQTCSHHVDRCGYQWIGFIPYNQTWCRFTKCTPLLTWIEYQILTLNMNQTIPTTAKILKTHVCGRTWWLRQIRA